MWSYCLLILMVLWILFDGFESYREYMGDKIKAEFQSRGEILEGNAKGILLSKTRLIFVIDEDKKVLDAWQIYSRKLIPFPSKLPAESIKGRQAFTEDIHMQEQAPLVLQAFYHAVQDYAHRQAIIKLEHSQWRIEQISEEQIEEHSISASAQEIKNAMKKITGNKENSFEALSQKERLFLQYLLLRSIKGPGENQEEEE